MVIIPRIEKLEKAVGVKFDDRSLLEQAVVHTSYCNENPALSTGHNERLEFLGDAVLDFIVAEKLYNTQPFMAEGKMSQRRAALVRRETLARVAGHLGLGSYLLLGRGEESTSGREKIPNLAGAMEAVIAAVYLDKGLDVTRDFVERLLEPEWSSAGRKGGSGIDYKSRLQEYCQARYQAMPDYRIVQEEGPDHDKRFTVEVSVLGKVYGLAVGKSKKAAETDAARMALEKLDDSIL
jgi:ribonuclease III